MLYIYHIISQYIVFYYIFKICYYLISYSIMLYYKLTLLWLYGGSESSGAVRRLRSPDPEAVGSDLGAEVSGNAAAGAAATERDRGVGLGVTGRRRNPGAGAEAGIRARERLGNPAPEAERRQRRRREARRTRGRKHLVAEMPKRQRQKRGAAASDLAWWQLSISSSVGKLCASASPNFPVPVT